MPDKISQQSDTLQPVIRWNGWRDTLQTYGAPGCLIISPIAGSLTGYFLSGEWLGGHNGLFIGIIAGIALSIACSVASQVGLPQKSPPKAKLRRKSNSSWSTATVSYTHLTLPTNREV